MKRILMIGLAVMMTAGVSAQSAVPMLKGVTYGITHMPGINPRIKVPNVSVMPPLGGSTSQQVMWIYSAEKDGMPDLSFEFRGSEMTETSEFGGDMHTLTARDPSITPGTKTDEQPYGGTGSFGHGFYFFSIDREHLRIVLDNKTQYLYTLKGKKNLSPLYRSTMDQLTGRKSLTEEHQKWLDLVSPVSDSSQNNMAKPAKPSEQE